MTPITNHKRYIFSLIALGIFSLLVLFDFDGQQKIESYNPAGIAHYNLPYDVFPPSSYLFKRVFLDSIEHFPDRDTLVFIGNSVMVGAGAKNTLHFNSVLKDDFNVINAALDGEELGASSALAVLAIEENFRRHPLAFQHIFVGYAASRMYVGAYALTGSALTNLAKDRNLTSYIVPYANKTPRDSIKQVIESIIAINMRCILSKNSVVNSFKNRSFYCVKPFDIEFKDPGFLKFYNRQKYPDTNQERKDLAEFMKDHTTIDNKLRRDDKVNNIVAQLAPLESFLVKHGVHHKIHFLLLRDLPEGIETFSIQKRDGYDLGRKAFLEELAQKKPGWRILEAPLLENSDFFDVVHMRESGQTKVAALIKQAITQNR